MPADPANATARQLWRLNNEGRLTLTNGPPLSRAQAGAAIASTATPEELDLNQLPEGARELLESHSRE